MIDAPNAALGEMVESMASITAEESAAASEGLSAQAETSMSVVGRLEALVGGGRTSAAPAARTAGREASRVPPADVETIAA